MGENEKTTKKSKSWEYEKYAHILGKWAWIFAILAALVNLLLAVYYIVIAIQAHQALVSLYGAALVGPLTLNYYDIWNVITSILLIIFALFIIRPRFSNKCAEKDWDYLLNDVLHIGSFRFPLMFIWAIIAEILGQWWGGVLIIIPAILLVFLGPKEYKWKK